MRLLLTLILLLLPLAGCSLDQKLPEKQRFILTLAISDIPRESGGGGALRVHRFRASPIFERRALVYRTEDDVFVEDFYNELYAQPGVLVREVTIRYLRALKLFDFVFEANDSRRADWLLEGRIENLYADLRDSAQPKAVLDIEFSLVDENSPNLKMVFQETYSESVVAESARPQDLIGAMSSGMRTILDRLSADLREEVLSAEPTEED